MYVMGAFIISWSFLPNIFVHVSFYISQLIVTTQKNAPESSGHSHVSKFPFSEMSFTSSYSTGIGMCAAQPQRIACHSRHCQPSGLRAQRFQK